MKVYRVWKDEIKKEYGKSQVSTIEYGIFTDRKKAENTAYRNMAYIMEFELDKETNYEEDVAIIYAD